MEPDGSYVEESEKLKAKKKFTKENLFEEEEESLTTVSSPFHIFPLAIFPSFPSTEMATEPMLAIPPLNLAILHSAWEWFSRGCYNCTLRQSEQMFFLFY